MTDATAPTPDLLDFTWVLLDLRHPGWRGTLELATELARKLEDQPQFVRLYERDGVVLFGRSALRNPA